jgi:hypothetical protein
VTNPIQIPASRTPLFYLDEGNNPLFSRTWYQYLTNLAATIAGVSTATTGSADLALDAPVPLAFDPNVLPALLIPEQSASLRPGIDERLYELEKALSGIQAALQQVAEARDALFELQKTVAGLQAGVVM